MFRKGPLNVVLCLLFLMAAVGMFDGTGALLMVAPFVLLLGLLIAGRYPGERLIEAASALVSLRRRSSDDITQALVELSIVLRPALLPGESGSRAPPRFA